MIVTIEIRQSQYAREKNAIKPVLAKFQMYNIMLTRHEDMCIIS